MFFLFVLASAQASWAASFPKGNVDGVNQKVDGKYYLEGWACDFGAARSNNIKVYAEGDNGRGQILIKPELPANRGNEAAVDQVCGTQGIGHRFSILLGNRVRANYGGRKIFAYSQSPNGSTLINSTRQFIVPPIRPLVGVIRWDGYSGGNITKGQEFGSFLNPIDYRWKAPWYTQLNVNSEPLFIDSSLTARQQRMDSEIELAADAGIDYWAFCYYEKYKTVDRWGGVGWSYDDYMTSQYK